MNTPIPADAFATLSSNEKVGRPATLTIAWTLTDPARRSTCRDTLTIGKAGNQYHPGYWRLSNGDFDGERTRGELSDFGTAALVELDALAARLALLEPAGYVDPLGRHSGTRSCDVDLLSIPAIIAAAEQLGLFVCSGPREPRLSGTSNAIGTHLSALAD